MKVGFLIMNFSQSSMACTGNLQAHHALIEQECQNQRLRHFHFVSLNAKGKHAENLSHLVKLSTRTFLSPSFGMSGIVGLLCETRIVPPQVDPKPQ
jgi:hypothetical protein